MEFIETPIFTKAILEFLSDDEYRALQLALLFRPENGALIKGSGGLRKLRWKRKGSGKRGGIRLIYYWDNPKDSIYMLLPYKKTAKVDLTRAQIKVLRRLVEEELK
jgi:mRNA-degrading endonuclease RelE of RelBE toxin-antitoxin system